MTAGPTIVPASAGTSTEQSCQQQYGSQKLMSFRGYSRKIRQNGEKICQKAIRRPKLFLFCPIYFSQSDSYRTIGYHMCPDNSENETNKFDRDFVLRKSEKNKGFDSKRIEDLSLLLA
jgi:hypothetical protein